MTTVRGARCGCTIMPPEILRQIAARGTKRQRNAALATLATDQTLRLARATYELLEAGAHRNLLAVPATTKQRTIYDAQNRETLPGRVVRTEGAAATADREVDEAYDGLGATFDFFADAYARNEAATALRLAMALADEANKYIDEHKPWVLAKQDGSDVELQAVCTQGLNLFRVLAAALKPVLPRVAQQAEAFLDAPVSGWHDLQSPLLAHHIAAYAPLFTRIDPKQIESMIDASRENLQPTAAATPAAAPTASVPAAKPAAGGPAQAATTATIGIDDFAKLDLRVGKVLACEFVDGSDKLLRFELDAGELGKRQIFSGIRAAYAEPEKLVGRKVVFIANLAPRKMRFGISQGMILSAGSGGADLHLLDVDAGASAGMPVK